MPIYNFHCVNGHSQDLIAKDPYRTLKCDCGEDLVYRPMMPYILNMRMGVDPHGCPTAGDKWAKAHEKGSK